MISSRRQCALLAALGLIPVSSAAHLVNTGLGPIYDGIGHLFLSLEDLLPLVALMTLGGLNGVAAGRRVMFVLPPAWFIGGVIGSLTMAGTNLPPHASAVLAIMLGVVVAADVRLSVKGLTRLIVVLAGILGLITGTMLATQANSLQMLIGSGAALGVLATALPATIVAVTASPSWMRVGVRVSGSWIAAAGLLLLGWQLRSS
jgi:urease accessory protein